YSVAGPTLAAKQLRNSSEIAQEVQFRLVDSTNPNAVPRCNYESLGPGQKGTFRDQGKCDSDLLSLTDAFLLRGAVN
ncbi:MAG: hypothetical protein KDB22_10135, partial [Planctomycetales bacterium]|nr:hypothetical protein [Planctomycetales bacterium]